jgi:uncharacterized membrane protein
MGASTKPEYWLGVLGFIIIISVALLYFGQSLQNSSEITLDEDSNKYLTSYTSMLNTTGMSNKADHELTKDDTKNIFESSLEGIKKLFDVFGVFTLLTNILVGFWSFISMMFNMPSFFIETLGLDLKNFKFIVNILGTILTLSATVMLVRLKK